MSNGKNLIKSYLMTNSNRNNSDRLDRIEAIVESLARSVQAITNDREERIQTLEIENKVDTLIERDR